MIAVSVVVPVYNPGTNIDALITSLLKQTLAAESFEAVFVDDGSTDGTAQRLDEVAAQHAHFSAIHIPNSGWPGRPRNVGLDAARGEYVFFADNDDWFGNDALRRAYAHAVEFGSDVVVAKEVGHGQTVQFDIFTKTRPVATILEGHLLEMLTPHKMFRREFLTEHELRFPEGKRRLEDHLFVIQAYFRARTISVLADYGYYHWARRESGANASMARLEPRGYFANLEEVLDVVEAEVPPGQARDEMLAHWYRSKVLGRLGGPRMLAMDEDYRQAFWDVTQDLTRRRFALAVDDWLPLNFRVRSHLFRTGRLGELVDLAEIEVTVRADLVLHRIVWDESTLVLEVEAGLRYQDGAPLEFTPELSGPQWVPPIALDPAALPGRREAGREFRANRLTGVIRERVSRTAYPVPSETVDSWLAEVDGVLTPRVRGTVRIAPRNALGGRRLRGTVDVLVRCRIAGWNLTQRISADSGLARSSAAPDKVVAKRRIRPYWTTPLANLSITSTTAPTPPSARPREQPDQRPEQAAPRRPRRTLAGVVRRIRRLTGF